MTKPPPRNDDAEKAVLGSVLRNCEVLPSVQSILRPEHAEELFHSAAHVVIYRTLCEVFERTKAVDLVMLGEAIHRVGSIGDVGGYGYVASLLDAAPTSANAEFYARIVADSARQRRYLYFGQSLTREVFERDPSTLAEWVESELLALRDRESTSASQPLGAEYSRALANMEDAQERLSRGGQPKPRGFTLGIPELDTITTLEPGTLTIVGARPSVGKSILGGQIALHLAEHHHPTLLVSCEMGRQEIAERCLAAHGAIRFRVVRGEEVGDESEVHKSVQAYNKLATMPLYVNDSERTLKGICSEARRCKLKHDLAALVVDYLQLIDGHRERGQSRAEELGRVSGSLKALAKDLQIPVVALCQLNRESERQPEPDLSDLRESGAIEQDADTVVLLWQKDSDSEDFVNGKIAKQRNGPKARFSLFRDAQRMRFQPWYPK